MTLKKVQNLMVVYKDQKPKVYKDQWSTRTKPHDGLQGPNNGGLQGPTKQYQLICVY